VKGEREEQRIRVEDQHSCSMAVPPRDVPMYSVTAGLMIWSKISAIDSVVGYRSGNGADSYVL